MGLSVLCGRKLWLLVLNDDISGMSPQSNARSAPRLASASLQQRLEASAPVSAGKSFLRVVVSSLNLGEYSNNTGNQFWACDFERSDLATAQVDEPTHATALPTFIILCDRTCMADPTTDRIGCRASSVPL
jgi:hypothetical protein